MSPVNQRPPLSVRFKEEVARRWVGLGLGGKRTMLIRWVSCTMSSLYAFLYTLMRRAYVKK